MSPAPTKQPAAKRPFLMTHEQFLAALPDELRTEGDLLYHRESFTRLIVAATFFLVVAVFSLVRDLLADFYNWPDQPLNFLNLIALLLLIVGSLAVLVAWQLQRRRHPGSPPHRAVTAGYYLVFNTALGLFMFNEFFRGIYFTYEEFYWIFFAIIPLLHLRACLANVILTSALYTVEFMLLAPLHGGTLLDYLYLLPLLFAFSAFGLYLRRYYLENIIYRLRSQALTAELERRSRFDPLTHCFNRYVLAERFEDWRRDARPLSVLIFDIDFFKTYNDGFSHVKGDECLLAVASAVSECCHGRTADLFRYGGEEFVILAAGLDEAKACDLCFAVLSKVRALALPMPPKGPRTGPSVTASIGMAWLVPTPSTTLESAVASADRQLYRAKAAGRNCAYYKNHKIS